MKITYRIVTPWMSGTSSLTFRRNVPTVERVWRWTSGVTVQKTVSPFRRQGCENLTSSRRRFLSSRPVVCSCSAATTGSSDRRFRWQLQDKRVESSTLPSAVFPTPANCAVTQRPCVPRRREYCCASETSKAGEHQSHLGMETFSGGIVERKT
jgi:hypothetical protein